MGRTGPVVTGFDVRVVAGFPGAGRGKETDSPLGPPGSNAALPTALTTP